MTLFVLALAVVPLRARASFKRTEWPLHATVLPNFTTDLSALAFLSRIESVLASTEPLEVRVGREALFGLDRDVRVRLIVTPRLTALHEALLDRSQDVVDFERPDIVGTGFHPHVTLVSGVSLPTGQRLRLSELVMAALRGDDAEIAWTRVLGARTVSSGTF